MKLIHNHKYDTEIQSQLDRANHLAHMRTVDIDDVYNAVAVLERKFKDCSKKSMEGLIVHVDLNSQHFPNAYRGVPMSTLFVLMNAKRSWRFIRAERLRCGESKRYEVTYLPEPMREELLKRFESFDR